jgi:hypothetical protein
MCESDSQWWLGMPSNREPASHGAVLQTSQPMEEVGLDLNEFNHPISLLQAIEVKTEQTLVV